MCCPSGRTLKTILNGLEGAKRLSLTEIFPFLTTKNSPIFDTDLPMDRENLRILSRENQLIRLFLAEIFRQTGIADVKWFMSAVVNSVVVVVFRQKCILDVIVVVGCSGVRSWS